MMSSFEKCPHCGKDLYGLLVNPKPIPAREYPDDVVQDRERLPGLIEPPVPARLFRDPNRFADGEMKPYDPQGIVMPSCLPQGMQKTVTHLQVTASEGVTGRVRIKFYGHSEEDALFFDAEANLGEDVEFRMRPQRCVALKPVESEPWKESLPAEARDFGSSKPEGFDGYEVDGSIEGVATGGGPMTLMPLEMFHLDVYALTPGLENVVVVAKIKGPALRAM